MSVSALRSRLRAGARAGLAGLLALGSSSCTTYEAAPLAPFDMLRQLNAIRLDAAPAGIAAIGTATRFDASDGLSVAEAAGVALHLNPRLRAGRAEIGVARAQLVEAGLLPDPVVGWDAMNVVADFMVERKSGFNSYIAGASVVWEVPRPGEIDAREGVARGRVGEARAALLRAEWELVRQVHLAFVRLAVVQASRELNAEQLAIAERTLEYFQRARGAGVATALQVELASVARDRVRADRVRIGLEEVAARQSTLALLGLPPEAPLSLQAPRELLAAPHSTVEDVSVLTEAAVTRRPDLAEVAAQYQQAEEALRLEVTRQWPQVWVGTGISISLPFFTRFNAPAIETARRAREVGRERFFAALHDVRREVHLARAALLGAAERVEVFTQRLLPGLDSTLRLTRASLEAGEVTPLEILTAQAQVIATQLEFLDARQRMAEARIELEAAAGALLPSGATPAGGEEDE